MQTKTLLKIIKEKRIEAGLTQKQMCRKLRLKTTTSYSRFENGKNLLESHKLLKLLLYFDLIKK